MFQLRAWRWLAGGRVAGRSLVSKENEERHD